MHSVKPKYSKDEFSRRGEEMFQQQITDQLDGVDPDKVIAIDIDSGDFEVADEMIEAVDRLRQRKPEAQVWMRRVGPGAIMRFGGAQGR